MKKFAMILSAIGLLFSTQLQAREKHNQDYGISTPYGGGGRILDVQHIISQYNASGKPFKIVGHCQSSCTAFLAIRNVCVSPSSTLFFHAGSGRSRGATSTINGIMYGSYNSKLRAYIDSHHLMDSEKLSPISGRDIIHKFGYRACS